MIVWRGLGILTFLYPLLLAGLGGAIGNAVADAGGGMVGGGLGMIVGAVAAFFHGQHINVTSPRKRFETWKEHERPRLRDAAARGQFAYNGYIPGNPHEADELIERFFADQQKQALAQNHTLFFVPMQWAAIAFAGIGLIMLIGGFFLRS